MRFILLFYALVIHGDKKLIINESLGFVIRQITQAVRSSVGVDIIYIIFSFQHNKREFKKAIIITIEHLVSLADPKLVESDQLHIADSASTQQVNKKLEYSLLLYKTTLPLIKQHIVY